MIQRLGAKNELRAQEKLSRAKGVSITQPNSQSEIGCS